MRSFQPPTRRFFVGLKNMGIIQLLINEGHEDKKKQQIVAEAVDIISELNKGIHLNEESTETEHKNDMDNKSRGTERGWIIWMKEENKRKNL